MTTTLYDAATGLPVRVEDGQVQDLLASNKYGFAAGELVPIVGPDGKINYSKPENVFKNLQQGKGQYSVESDEARAQREHGGPIDFGLAVTKGLTEGGTYGFSDGLAYTAGVSQKRLREIEDSWPVTYETAKIAGTVGSFFIGTGEAGLAAKAIKGVTSAIPRFTAKAGTIAAENVGALALKALTTKGVAPGLAKKALARIAGGVAGGAAEGTVFAIGQAVHEKALGDYETVGEALAANGLKTVLFSSVLGGALGGVAAIAEPQVMKIGNWAQKRILEVAETKQPELVRLSNQKAFESIFGEKLPQLSNFLKRKNKSGSWYQKASDVLRDKDLLGDGKAIIEGANMSDVHARLIAAAKLSGKNIEDARVWADQAAELLEKALIQEGTIIVDRTTRQVLGRNVRGQSARELFTIDPVAIKNKLTTLAKKYAGDIRYGQATAQLTKTAQEMEGLMQGGLSYSAAGKMLTNLGESFKSGIADRGIARQAEQDVWKIIKTEMDTKFTNLCKQTNSLDALAKYNQANEVYHAVGDISKLLKSTGPAIVARAEKSVGVLDAFAKPALSSLVWHLRPNSLGLSLLGRAAGVGGIAAVTRGGIREAFSTPGEIAQTYARKAAQLGSVQRTMSEAQSRIDRAIGILSGTKKAAKGIKSAGIRLMAELSGERKDTRLAAKKVAMEMYRVQPEFGNRSSAYLRSVVESAPETSKYATLKMAEANRHLLDTAPKVPRYGLQPSLDIEKWKPNHEEASRFAQQLAAIFDPIGVFEDIANGVASPLSVKTVRDKYPKMYNAVVQQIGEEIAAAPKPISYEKIRAISLLLPELRVDPTMSPESIRLSQMAFVLPQSQQNQQPPTSKKALAKVDEEQYMSAAQRLEVPI